MAEEGREGNAIVLTVGAIGIVALFVLAAVATTDPPDDAPIGPSDLFASRGA